MPDNNHFIHCNHCGHLNLFRTEFLTFCESCGRKLENNFQDWSKQNPGKSLSDFRKDVCISRVPENITAVKKAEAPSAKISRKVKTAGIVIFMMLFVATLIFFSNTSFSDLLLSKKLPGSFLNTEWQSHNIGNPPLSFESPEPPQSSREVLPESLMKYTESFNTHEIHPSKSLMVYFHTIIFQQGVVPNLQPVAYSVMNDLVAIRGVQMVEFDESPVMSMEVRGIHLEGSFHEDGVFKKFRFLIFVHRNQVYIVKATADADDPVALKVAERLIDSVEIDTRVENI